MTTHRTRTRLAGLGVAAVVLLGACGSSSDDASSSTGDAAETTTTVETAASVADASTAPIEVEDAWVKATDEEMSAMFGVLRNTSDEDITVTAGSTEIAGKVELHETVESASGEMQMQPKEGGFVIPAGGELTLQPGADHVMLMMLTAPIVAGDEVTVTLELSDGSTVSVTAVAKDYSGANENYEEGESGDMGETTSMGG